MDHGIGRVLKLLGQEDPGILLGHAAGCPDTGVDAGADIPIVMNEAHLGSVLADELAPFLGDGVRHDNNCPVALYGAAEGKSDALVSAGGLHHDAVRSQKAFFFGIFDHGQGDPGLDGTACVYGLVFNIDVSASCRAETV